MNGPQPSSPEPGAYAPVTVENEYTSPFPVSASVPVIQSHLWRRNEPQ